MNILFFDGVCGLCNFWVDFVLKRDRRRRLLFSPLQSEFAAQALPAHYREDLDTLVLLVGEKIFTKSDAVLKILVLMGGFWNLAAVGYLVPRFLRDALYDWVARNRYAWFGQKETCRMHTPEERERFRL